MDSATSLECLAKADREITTLLSSKDAANMLFNFYCTKTGPDAEAFVVALIGKVLFFRKRYFTQIGAGQYV